MSPEKKDRFDKLLKNHLSASLRQTSVDSCPDENRIAAYLEGSQTEPFKRAFERHLLQCDRCQSEMASLLRTGVMEAQSRPAVPEKPRSDLRTLIFGWTRVTAFRPVFAILLVSVVTGVVGYQVLREKNILQLHPAETAQAPSLSNAPVALPDSSPAQQQPDSPASDLPLAGRKATQDQLEAPRKSRTQPESRVSGGRMNSQDARMKDTYAAEPPSTAPAESNREAVGERERRDVTAISQAVPEPLQKESQSASVANRQSSRIQTREEEAVVQSKNQAMPAAPPPARPALGGLSRSKMEQDSAVNAKEDRSLGASLYKKKQVLSESPEQAGAVAAAEAKAVSHIEVGGKRFDLRGRLWRDASILPDDPQPTLVNLNSPDFERVRKQLAPYQPVISRPEDVLIKLHNQVYRVQKEPKASR